LVDRIARKARIFRLQARLQDAVELVERIVVVSNADVWVRFFEGFNSGLEDRRLFGRDELDLPAGRPLLVTSASGEQAAPSTREYSGTQRARNELTPRECDAAWTSDQAVIFR
jgi:hypothetical protein